ncbi:phosphoglycerate mutase-like protein [Trichocladium antarcticum]|uniref:Phosphoglycerate mutase-like protein n=1 Tax=Trichocladium antarcticum TaxID=1450529 RepID=A0AAN6UHD6_9PEZI|nr:phosphoglycerate mutase-like protein [Trichocladium antarcticum]
MRDQGAAFRNRYLTGSSHGDRMPIDVESINGSHLGVASSANSYTTESAAAFVQGFHPRLPVANGSVLNDSHRVYEHPDTRIIYTCLDQDSIWIQGGAGCRKHEDSLLDFERDYAVSSFDRDHKAFYQSLWDRVFCEAFPRARTNFYNAYDLYDYAAFRWNHDNETRSLMTAGELARLRLLASTEQRLRHANLSHSEGTDGDQTHAIAGRTLAGRVVHLFSQNIDSRGERNKLSLVFTSHEPFLAFFALADLSASSGLFTQLPHHGATMTFELFSTARHSNETAYPATDALRARFLYRNSTNPRTPFETHPIFGHADSCMPFARFKTAMSDVGVGDAATWCRVCASRSCFCGTLGDLPRGANLLIVLLVAGAVVLILSAIVLI